jgi:hypothetical protein
MKKILVFIALAGFFASCGPTQKVTSSWVNKEFTPSKKYETLFIMALVQNQSARNILETDMAKAAESRGLKVYKSSEIFAPTFQKNELPDKDAIIQKVKELGCDGLLSTHLVDKQSETRYVQGTTTYMPYGGYGYGWGGYYGMAGTYYSNPGYYTTDKTYFMEANLFDVETQKLIYSAQSEAYNPSNISSFSRDYTSVLLESIKKDLVNKKK